jgi:hypothetical protein
MQLLFLFRKRLIPLNLLNIENEIIQPFNDSKDLSAGQGLPADQIFIL